MMFEEQAAEAAGEAENISGKEKDNSERYKDFVFLSPYETVMKSYMKLEDSLRNAVRRKVDDGTIELPPHSNDRRFEVMHGNHLMRLLYKAGLVDLDFAALHDSLRNLRNMAAHKHNFEISQDAAKNYADSSIALIDKLEEIWTPDMEQTAVIQELHNAFNHHQRARKTEQYVSGNRRKVAAARFR